MTQDFRKNKYKGHTRSPEVKKKCHISHVILVMTLFLAIYCCYFSLFGRSWATITQLAKIIWLVLSPSSRSYFWSWPTRSRDLVSLLQKQNGCKAKYYDVITDDSEYDVGMSQHDSNLKPRLLWIIFWRNFLSHVALICIL